MVCQGIPILRNIGLGMIGNNPTTVDGKGISFLQAHSEGNQNINNLRFVYENKDGQNDLLEKKKLMLKINPTGIRILRGIVNEKNN